MRGHPAYRTVVVVIFDMVVLGSREPLSPADARLGQAVGYFILFDSLNLALESMLYGTQIRDPPLTTLLSSLYTIFPSGVYSSMVHCNTAPIVRSALFLAWSSVEREVWSSSRTISGSKARQALLFVIVFMLLCSSTLWALDIVVLNASIRAYFIDDIELPFSERVQKGRSVIAMFNRIQDVIYSFEVRLISPTALFAKSNFDFPS